MYNAMKKSMGMQMPYCPFMIMRPYMNMMSNPMMIQHFMPMMMNMMNPYFMNLMNPLTHPINPYLANINCMRNFEMDNMDDDKIEDMDNTKDMTLKDNIEDNMESNSKEDIDNTITNESNNIDYDIDTDPNINYTNVMNNNTPCGMCNIKMKPVNIKEIKE